MTKSFLRQNFDVSFSNFYLVKPTPETGAAALHLRFPTGYTLLAATNTAPLPGHSAFGYFPALDDLFKIQDTDVLCKIVNVNYK